MELVKWSEDCEDRWDKNHLVCTDFNRDFSGYHAEQKYLSDAEK